MLRVRLKHIDFLIVTIVGLCYFSLWCKWMYCQAVIVLVTKLVHWFKSQHLLWHQGKMELCSLFAFAVTFMLFCMWSGNIYRCRFCYQFQSYHQHGCDHYTSEMCDVSKDGTPAYYNVSFDVTWVAENKVTAVGNACQEQNYIYGAKKHRGIRYAFLSVAHCVIMVLAWYSIGWPVCPTKANYLIQDSRRV